jgi:hypothetical protein
LDMSNSFSDLVGEKDRAGILRISVDRASDPSRTSH